MPRPAFVFDAFLSIFLKDYVDPKSGDEFKKDQVVYVTVLDFERLGKEGIIDHFKSQPSDEADSE